MISERDIIHFSLDNFWQSDPHSRRHLTYQFWKNHNRIFWINTFGMRIPKISEKGNLKKYINKFISYKKFIKKIDDRLWVFSPIALPLVGSNLLSRIHDYILLQQIKYMIKIFKINKPILFVTSPMYANIIDKIEKDLIIYYYSDDYASYREITKKNEIKSLDNKTLFLADYTFCVAKEIYKNAKKKVNNAYYLPHAVDFKHFNKILHSKTVKPKDLLNIESPIIGYFGSLSDSNDIELIKYLAENKPKYSIVLIGKHSDEYKELKTHRNVYLLGRKPYQDIPLYGKYLDVCFMAWKYTEWIKNCSPLKTLEYLALGKPIVSMPINELLNFDKDIISIAYGNHDFVKKIDENLANNTKERKNKRIEFVKEQTWEKRFEQMVKIIEEIN